MILNLRTTEHWLHCRIDVNNGRSLANGKLEQSELRNLRSICAATRHLIGRTTDDYAVFYWTRLHRVFVHCRSGLYCTECDRRWRLVRRFHLWFKHYLPNRSILLSDRIRKGLRRFLSTRQLYVLRWNMLSFTVLLLRWKMSRADMQTMRLGVPSVWIRYWGRYCGTYYMTSREFVQKTNAKSSWLSLFIHMLNIVLGSTGRNSPACYSTNEIYQ